MGRCSLHAKLMPLKAPLDGSHSRKRTSLVEHDSLIVAAMASEKGVSHQEEMAASRGGRRTFGQKLKRSCQRFWWIYLFVFIGIVLVVVLPIIYVGYPKMAQSSVNESKLHVTAESILNPAPNAFDLNLTSELETHAKYHPQLDAFEASLYLKDSDIPFATFNTPAIKADNGTVSQVLQRVEIQNLTEFTRYTMVALASEEYTIYLRGNGGLKQGSLPKTDVDYNQEVQMIGLNGLKGLEVTEFHLLTESLADGSNAIGNVTVPNPSVMTLALGDVSFDMSVEGTFIGNATMPDLTLRPGNHSYPIHVTSNQTRVATIIQRPEYHCGVFPVDIAGKQSVYGGQVLPYYTEALMHNDLTTMLNVSAALNEVGFGFALGNCTS